MPKLIEHQKELLTKLQQLHKVIEIHPGLSGLLTEQFHNWLDDIAIGKFNEIDLDLFRNEPDFEILELIG